MALPASDDFNRADNTDLGANWTPNTHDGGTLQIFLNQVIHLVNSDASEVWNADTFPQDQYSQVTFSVTGANGVGSGYGPTCRELTSAQTYYRLICNLSGYSLDKGSAGSFSSLSSGSGTTFTTNDVARLEATGTSPTTLRMYKNGVQFGGDIVDSSSPLTAAGACGVGYSSTDGDTAITSWEAGAVASASGIVTAWITA